MPSSNSRVAKSWHARSLSLYLGWCSNQTESNARSFCGSDAAESWGLNHRTNCRPGQVVEPNAVIHSWIFTKLIRREASWERRESCSVWILCIAFLQSLSFLLPTVWAHSGLSSMWPSNSWTSVLTSAAGVRTSAFRGAFHHGGFDFEGDWASQKQGCQPLLSSIRVNTPAVPAIRAGHTRAARTTRRKGNILWEQSTWTGIALTENESSQTQFLATHFCNWPTNHLQDNPNSYCTAVPTPQNSITSASSAHLHTTDWLGSQAAKAECSSTFSFSLPVPILSLAILHGLLVEHVPTSPRSTPAKLSTNMAPSTWSMWAHCC